MLKPKKMKDKEKTLKEPKWENTLLTGKKELQQVPSANNCKQEENGPEQSFERQTLTNLEFCSQRNSLQT